MIDEHLDDQNHSNVMVKETFVNKDDTADTSEVPPKTSESIAAVATLKDSTLLSTPPKFDVFENILNEPIINLSQTQPPPLPISTFVPIKSSIQPLPKSLSEPTSYIKPLYHFSLRSSLTPQ